MKKLSISHILTQHRYECEDLLRRLQKGENFIQLAKQHSLCSSAAQGGYLGVVPLAKLDSDFAEACESLSPGKYSAPVRTRFGFHIILVHN